MIEKLSESEKSEIIEMALSDHTSFKSIKKLYGLRETEVKKLMRDNLKEGSYKAWRKRVRIFSNRRHHYK
jgi:uncharacterized protein (TIGR03643 family)|tara:strand:- start:163 stop:372 length:210 start_codon:yes stop_codon:yes gene_type:complete